MCYHVCTCTTDMREFENGDVLRWYVDEDSEDPKNDFLDVSVMCYSAAYLSHAEDKPEDQVQTIFATVWENHHDAELAAKVTTRMTGVSVTLHSHTGYSAGEWREFALFGDPDEAKHLAEIRSLWLQGDVYRIELEYADGGTEHLGGIYNELGEEDEFVKIAADNFSPKKTLWDVRDDLDAPAAAPEGFTVSRGGDHNRLAMHHDECGELIVYAEGMNSVVLGMIAPLHDCENNV